MRSWLRWWWFGLVLLGGCDRGIEANQDNLTHFASVASELRRDSRELELLAAKVEGVQKRLERRKSDLAEHVLSQDMAARRQQLLAQLRPATAADDPALAPAAPDPKAIAGVLTLHEELLAPLQFEDDSLRSDNDYWWWLEELGLQSADTSNLGDEYLEDAPSELERTAEDCRTSVDQDARIAACNDLLVNHLNAGHFDRMKKQRQAELDLQIERLGLIRDEFAEAAVERNTSAEKVMAAYGSSFDGLIIWGFPALIVAVLIIVLFEGRRRKAGELPPTMDTLAVVTVLLLVSAIIILGLGGKIQPEALGTLIGGISGYVLGKGAQLLGGSASDKGPATEKPATSDTPAADQPSEKPAATEQQPAATEKPATEKPATEKPATEATAAKDPAPAPGAATDPL